MNVMRNTRLLALFNFCTDFKPYAPLMIVYFEQVTGSFTLGMSVFSVIMISSALLEIPTGIISDRVGRKRTMILGALASVIYTLLYAWAEAFNILLVAATFEGLSRAFYSGNNDALLYDSLKEAGKVKQYASWLGKTSSLFQIALATSAVLGSLFSFVSMKAIFWIAVPAQIAALIISLLIVSPTIQSEKSGNIFEHLKQAFINFMRNKKLRLLSLASMINFALGEANYQFQAAFYATVWPNWAIFYAKLASNAGATVSFMFSGKALKRTSPIKALMSVTIISKILSITGAVLANIFSPILMSATSLLYGLNNVAKQTLLQEEFKDEQRATMGSLNAFGGSLLFGLVAISIGAVADALSPAKAVLLFQTLSLSTLFIYWRLSKHHA